jgi:predicted nucleotidyltransferase
MHTLLLGGRTRASTWHEGEMTGPEIQLGGARARYVSALEHALEEIVARLAGMPEVERVMLFGSYAAGRRDLFTDLDLLVVMTSDQDFVHRTAELYRRVAQDVDMDLIVYTPEEFEAQRNRGFVRRALETGRVLYEKERAGRG